MSLSVRFFKHADTGVFYPKHYIPDADRARVEDVICASVDEVVRQSGPGGGEAESGVCGRALAHGESQRLQASLPGLP